MSEPIYKGRKKIVWRLKDMERRYWKIVAHFVLTRKDESMKDDVHWVNVFDVTIVNQEGYHQNFNAVSQDGEIDLMKVWQQMRWEQQVLDGALLETHHQSLFDKKGFAVRQKTLTGCIK